MFNDLNLKLSYRSNRDNIAEDFYQKVLSQTIIYKRAVGYFSTNSFLILENALDDLMSNKGKIQLIASPQLTEDDIKSISKGYDARNKIIEKRIIDSIYLPEDAASLNSLSKVERMIALGNLDIKIAFSNKIGIFHEKIGIVSDISNNKIAFTGSLNETGNALSNNFESIDLYVSWNDRDNARVIEKERDFDSLWNNTTKNLEVLDFTDAVHKKLLKYIEDGLLSGLGKNKITQNIPHVPQTIKIRGYQEEAYQLWEKNNFKGILEMATGTGKTITACYSLVKLYQKIIDRKKKQVVIVMAPYKHLVEQWYSQMQNFGYNPIKVYSELSWEPKVRNQISRLKLDPNKKQMSIITTNMSFSSDKFLKLINGLNEKIDLVLVADEAHNVGTSNLLSKLPEKIEYRLGLTATPIRHNDESGTKKLLNYFNGIVFKFTLKDAIEKEFLTKYYYYPQIVYLDQNEYKELSDVIKEFKGLSLEQLKKLSFKNKKFNDALKLTYQIADGSINKFIAFKEKISEYKNSNYNLVYCTSVNINDGVEKFRVKQIEAITAYMGNELKMRVHPFTQEENMELRAQLINRFSSGDDLQALIAIKCLDEGVDIPAIKRAFILSSTTNEKQFIQRRGRVLRKYPGKEYAEIFDFITLPRQIDDNNEVIDDTEKFLVIKECKRIRSFSELAINSEEGGKLLTTIQNEYDVDLDGDIDE